MNDLGQEGFVLPLRTDVRDEVEEHVLETVQAATTSSRGLNGVPFQLSVKSLVWYSPRIFDELGYKVPATWEDLKVLSDRMRGDGFEAWCMGISAFDATGWPATDLVEDIVLREQSTEFYDAWVEGTIPFTDPVVGSMIDTFGSVTLGSGVSDRRRSIINTTPAQAMNPMFAEEPGCLMYKQASFQKANLPSGTDIGPDGDVDVFVLPGNYSETPVLIGGDIAAAMTNRNETWELLAYLASPESAAVWADLGGFVAAQDDLGDEIYHDEFDARMSEILKNADVIRFDGSDQMYAPVGTDSFFDAMTVYVASGRTQLAQDVAQAGYDR